MLLSELWPWFIAFIFTQCMEVPIYLRVTQSWRTSFLASTFTHPIVWFVIPALWPENGSYLGLVIACELFAVLAEAIWFRLNGIRRALLLSFLGNGASAVGGLLLRHIFGVP